MKAATAIANTWFPLFPPIVNLLQTDHIIAEQEENIPDINTIEKKAPNM